MVMEKVSNAKGEEKGRVETIAENGDKRDSKK